MANETNYIEAGVEAAERLLGIYKDSESWRETKKTEDIIVYGKQSTEFGGHIYKAELVVDGAQDVAMKTWLPHPLGTRMEWDSFLELCEIIKDFGDDTMIMRTVSKSIAMGLISKREFCDIVKISHYTDLQAISSSCYSIEYPDCPIQSSYVRGKNYACGAFFRAVSGEENKCEMTYIVQSDIGGMLPRTLVDSAVPNNMVKMMQTFKSAVANK
ncbi:stAR-related lipid transfer protein 5-like [Anneissia japonica]|uniref:stAR-related lipid transfer protein 5-like n=1 Tax=Anneissia japonica TaxID=1529436 RepID=UPI0014257ACA|nr:stAR-related lipid transfer protein 5-like [Anneissia japonica]XP_033121503.1 stAR-related lipid transfer protein 5-like [Anneissia japonica]XP_033121504.1 stAR-related lipid transfer protein 5-like [Anneissia japonica]